MTHLTREQVEHLVRDGGEDSAELYLQHDAALRQQLAEKDRAIHAIDNDRNNIQLAHDVLRQRVDELERDQHKPTVTYWMNQFTLMQQEAKKRFDDWFVLRQQVDDLTAKLAKVMEENADMKAQLTQESQDAINKQVIIDGLRSERARHTAQLADLTEQLAQAQQDLADLPTLRKDLSMCLIQLQEARGRILSMESEVDMVRAQLDARRT